MACSEILHNLYLGNQHSTSTARDIDVIISIGCNHKSRLNVASYKFSVRDSQESDLTPLFDEVTSIIQHHINLGERVLVHCQGGINRSPAFVLAYLCRYSSMNIENAMQHIKVHRKSARFQPHYVAQVQQWLVKLQSINEIVAAT